MEFNMVQINETMRVIHELVGKDGKKVFEKQEFLNKISAINNDAARAIEDSVKGVTNPTFEVSGKATANYNIASLKIKDGDKVIGTGSGSVSFGDYTDFILTKIESLLALYQFASVVG